MSNLFNIYKILFRHIRDSIVEYLKNWKFNIKKLITTNVKEKGIAIILALLTFIYVRFQNVEQRNLFVPLQIQKIDELTFINELPENVSLFVSGNRSALNNLDVNKIVARIDLSDVTIPGVYQRSPILESLPEGIQVIRMSPQNLVIELSNLEKKLLKIEPTLLGRVKPGFRLERVEVTPNRLWVFGPPEIMNDITKIETETIILDGLDQSKQFDIGFSKNTHPGLQFDRNRRLSIQVNIASEYVRQNLVEPIQMPVVLTNNLSLTGPIFISNISFEIDKDEINNLVVEEDLVFYFDTSTIKTPGSYDVNIQVRKSNKVRSVSYLPLKAKIEVVVGKNPDTDASSQDF